jgi:hypothetical protein
MFIPSDAVGLQVCLEVRPTQVLALIIESGLDSGASTPLEQWRKIFPREKI